MNVVFLNLKVFNYKLSIIHYQLNFCRGVEQLVARRAHNPEAIGSNPIPATIIFYNSITFKSISMAR